MAVAGFSCQGKGMSDKDDNAERLAQALRDNLKRRKAQARGKGDTGAKAGPRTGAADKR